MGWPLALAASAVGRPALAASRSVDLEEYTIIGMMEARPIAQLIQPRVVPGTRTPKYSSALVTVNMVPEMADRIRSFFTYSARGTLI